MWKRDVSISGFYRGAYNPEAITEADIDKYVNRYSAPGGMRSGFEYFRAIPVDEGQNIENTKTKLQMPILVMGGSASSTLK